MLDSITKLSVASPLDTTVTAETDCLLIRPLTAKPVLDSLSLSVTSPSLFRSNTENEVRLPVIASNTINAENPPMLSHDPPGTNVLNRTDVELLTFLSCGSAMTLSPSAPFVGEMRSMYHPCCGAFPPPPLKSIELLEMILIVFVTPDDTSISSVTIDCGCKMTSGCVFGGRFLELTEGTEVPKSLIP